MCGLLTPQGCAVVWGQAASVIDTEEYITTSYSRGFPVGYSDTNKNHYLCVPRAHERQRPLLSQGALSERGRPEA